MNFGKLSRRRSKQSLLDPHRMSIQLRPEPALKSGKKNQRAGGFTLNITNIPRRPQRKSLLGTRKVVRESLLPPSEMTVEETLPDSAQQQHNDPTPHSPKTVFEALVSQSSTTPSPNVMLLPQQQVDFSPKPNCSFPSPHVNVSSLPKRCLEIIFSQDAINDHLNENKTIVETSINDVSVLATTLIDETCDRQSQAEKNMIASSAVKLSPPKIEFSPVKRQLDTIFSQDAICDSFEEHETMLRANDNDESVLIDEMVTDSGAEKKTQACDRTMINGTPLFELKDEQLELFADWFNMLDSMISVKNQEAANLQKQLDEVYQQIRTYEQMKSRIKSTFNLSEEQLLKKSKFRETLDDQTSIDSECHLIPSLCVTKTVKGDETLKDLRSNLKFLKTPKASRFSRSSILLTPHSMSFSIKAQLENLMD